MPTEIPDRLLALFTTQVEATEDSYLFEVPKQEVEAGVVQPGGVYRIAVGPPHSVADSPDCEDDEEKQNHDETSGPPESPPVATGDTRAVTIEDLGTKGDGVSQVENGYVIIVPDTEIGDRVRIRVTEVKPNVAFAEVIEFLDNHMGP